MIGRRYAGTGLGLLHVVFLAMLSGCSSPAVPAGPAHVDTDDVAQFLDSYWRRPLAPQGVSPSQFTPLEAALDPTYCAACHLEQFRDWSGSRHAQAMGPGVLGQLMDTDGQARDEQQDCLRCHAPLAEQADSLAAALSKQNAATGASLHEQGVICAACHVRENRHFGPARRDGSAPKQGDHLPHGGWQASPAFTDSRFCESCHQFEADGYELPSVRGGRLRPEREVARKHLRGMEGQFLCRRGQAMPVLPHAGSAPSLARHPRPGDGAQRRQH